MSERSPELIAAEERIERALSEWVKLKGLESDEAPVTGPIIVAWVAAVEVTSIELEQEDRAARFVAVGHTQPLSASAGLGGWIAQRYLG